MDYENKYKEAQKWIESIYSELSHEQQMEAEAFFPELKESENERVRKGLVKAVSGTFEGSKLYGSDVTREEALAWLEKQGEQKVPVVDFKAKDWYVSKVDGKIHNIYNSVDKVEPKFHEGEWITNGDYTWKIVEVKPLDYILQSQDGNIVDDTISHVDEQFHSFTIEDAKDGDLLAGKIDGDNYILIFKQIKDGWIETHGHYYNTVDRFCAPSQLFCKDYKGVFHPATKEQRDTLMKAMADAGYTFDFEKKELKKVEQKPQRMISAEAKEALYDKPTWSEEDEKKFSDILAILRGGENCYYNSPILIDWLKSLKERYTWKPSDEQMKALHDLNLTGNISYAGQGQILIELYNDLKKLTK